MSTRPFNYVDFAIELDELRDELETCPDRADCLMLLRCRVADWKAKWGLTEDQLAQKVRYIQRTRTREAEEEQ